MKRISREKYSGWRMEAVFARKADLAIMIATGGGKTAVVAGPIMMEKGVSLWLSPLKALLRETAKNVAEIHDHGTRP